MWGVSWLKHHNVIMRSPLLQLQKFPKTTLHVQHCNRHNVEYWAKFCLWVQQYGAPLQHEHIMNCSCLFDRGMTISKKYQTNFECNDQIKILFSPETQLNINMPLVVKWIVICSKSPWPFELKSAYQLKHVISIGLD